MKNKFLFSLALGSLISANAWALVDYSEPVEGGKSSSASNKSMQKIPSASSGGGAKGLTWKADYSLITNYESMEIAGNKYGVINIGAHVQTPANIFLEASYWKASSDEGSQNGNPKFIIGFNWLRLGSPSDEARLDIYGGARLSSSSKIGTSRTDKIVGVETTKRFGTFGLGIGVDHTITGRAKNADEKAIGNITRIVVSGGWMVSNDIQFEIEAENFKIAEASDTSKANRLSEKASFSTLSPKFNLGLSSAINLEMGARFRMKKAKEDADLMAARVFDLHGANANSLFAGLNFTI